MYGSGLCVIPAKQNVCAHKGAWSLPTCSVMLHTSVFFILNLTSVFFFLSVHSISHPFHLPWGPFKLQSSSSVLDFVLRHWTCLRNTFLITTFPYPHPVWNIYWQNQRDLSREIWKLPHWQTGNVFWHKVGLKATRSVSGSCRDESDRLPESTVCCNDL